MSFFIIRAIAAQQIITHTNLLWFNYNNNLILNQKWSVRSDIQIRSRDWASRWSQFAVRTAVTQNINKKFAVSGGFAWFGNVRYFNEDAVIANEWRPWEEISFESHLSKSSLIQRLRLEQRFLQKIINGKKINDFEFRHRLRYRLEFGFPLLKEQQLAIHFGNEVMVNVNHFKNNLFFDQNRLFVILNVKLFESIIFQYQFLKIFQWQAATNILENQNVFRFSIHQQIVRKSKKNMEGNR